MLSESLVRSDSELFSAVASGTPGEAVAAESALVERYSVLVKKIARPFFLSGCDSEDMFQEGMMGLLMAVRSFDPDKSPVFAPYAEICVRNRLYSAVRKGLGGGKPLDDYISINAPSDPDDDGAAPELPDDTDLLGGVILRDEVERVMRGVAAVATPLERKVLDGYLRGLSIREVAASIGKEPKACENAIYRIRKKADKLRAEEK